MGNMLLPLVWLVRPNESAKLSKENLAKNRVASGKIRWISHRFFDPLKQRGRTFVRTVAQMPERPDSDLQCLVQLERAGKA